MLVDLTNVLLAFVHYIAAFAVVTILTAQLFLLHDEFTLINARRLQQLNAMLGVAAGVLLVLGLFRALLFGDGYFISNTYFLMKLALFILVAGLSIVPTVEFFAWRTATNQNQAPTVDVAKVYTMRMILQLQLAAVVLIVLLSVLTVRSADPFQ
jgi:putative membrane protein